MSEVEKKLSMAEHATSKYADPAAPWKVGCLMLSVLLVISVLTSGFGFGGWKSDITGQVIQQPTANNQPQAQGKAELKEDGDPSIGDKSAPVTIFEFSDYQCPFCQRASQLIYPEIQKLAKEGKVQYILKDYPLPSHSGADEAATAATCAGQQGKYWEMHDKLFESQEAWVENSDPLTIFKGYAKDLKLDEKKFTACVTDPKVAKEIQDDVGEGSAAGVEGTPTFFINGQKVVGAQPWSTFEAIINQELSK